MLLFLINDLRTNKKVYVHAQFPGIVIAILLTLISMSANLIISLSCSHYLILSNLVEYRYHSTTALSEVRSKWELKSRSFGEYVLIAINK